MITRKHMTQLKYFSCRSTVNKPNAQFVEFKLILSSHERVQFFCLQEIIFPAYYSIFIVIHFFLCTGYSTSHFI
jgi:hypothetical protein